MPPDFLHALVDPTAPLPSGWPGGLWGAFLLFLVPVGGGIPVGVLMARDAGASPFVTAFLYLISDVLLAFTTEPFIALMRWLGHRVPLLARIGDRLARLTGSAGLKDDGPRGPLGLILVSFSISPTTGRAAAAAAGHGFVPGWTLAIIGDMGYFALLMVSTLWLSGFTGDDRISIGAVLLGTWLLPLALRKFRRAPRQSRPANGRLAVVPANPIPVTVVAESIPTLEPRPFQAARQRRTLRGARARRRR